jgi:hypothetical protein
VGQSDTYAVLEGCPGKKFSGAEIAGILGASLKSVHKHLVQLWRFGHVECRVRNGGRYNEKEYWVMRGKKGNYLPPILAVIVFFILLILFIVSYFWNW